MPTWSSRSTTRRPGRRAPAVAARCRPAGAGPPWSYCPHATVSGWPPRPGSSWRCWVTGTPVRWERLHAGSTRRPISLPTYPFARHRYPMRADRRDRAPETAAVAALGRVDGLLDGLIAGELELAVVADELRAVLSL